MFSVSAYEQPVWAKSDTPQLLAHMKCERPPCERTTRPLKRDTLNDLSTPHRPTRCRCPRRQDYVFEPNYQRLRHVRAMDFSHADHPIRLERLMQVEMSRDAHGGTVIGRLEIALAMLSTLR